jgi:hypothetical protein
VRDERWVVAFPKRGLDIEGLGGADIAHCKPSEIYPPTRATSACSSIGLLISLRIGWRREPGRIPESERRAMCSRRISTYDSPPIAQENAAVKLAL